MASRSGVSNRHYTPEFKQKIVDAYLTDELTPAELADRFNVGCATVKRIIDRHKNGEPQSRANPVYTVEFKNEIIADYNKDETQTHKEIAEKFGVAPDTVRRVIVSFKNGLPLDRRNRKRNPCVVLPERSAEEQQHNSDQLDLFNRGLISQNEYLFGKQA